MRARSTPLTRSRTTRAAVALTLVGVPAVLAGASLTPAYAVPDTVPGVKLYASSAEKSVTRPRGQAAYAQLPVWVTPNGHGDFDLRVERADYESPLTVRQVVHADDGTTSSYDVPGVATQGWRGLRNFATTTITSPTGEVTTMTQRPFCPDNWELQRLEPESVDNPSYPEWCGGQPFTLGAVWGIDAGWGVPAEVRGVRLVGPRGDYTVTTTISPRYQQIFAISPQDATATVTYHVSNGPAEPSCRGCRTAARHADAAPAEAAPRPHVREMVPGPGDPLPDLQALPSFSISVDHRGGHDFLAFASTVWIGGTSRMDIEGFRQRNTDTMTAYQYFYDGDEVVGRADVGELDFDTRRNHHHWHLQQFARYRLLNADQSSARLSKKQSFCLAPTDPVNLALDGAAWRQTSEDLGSACGGEEAVWIRETLPLGWGDTYYQNRGGQDFNITTVPNGTYYVSVEANPTGDLFETRYDNNTALRKVILKGKPGHRKVCVPAVGVIPVEGSCGNAVG
jgi:hypothetical protein